MSIKPDLKRWVSPKVPKGKVYVNLGCGTNIIPNWINIDEFPLPIDGVLRGDARAIPLESNSVDYLLCDQVLEHISFSDVPSVLWEIRRVLKVGGRCVIIVPDFKNAVEQWLSLDHDRKYNPYTYHFLSEVIYGNQMHDGEYHRTPMCAGFLNHSLRMVGLVKHELIVYPANGVIPMFPGVPNYANGGGANTLRNSQLVADIIKTQ